MAQKIEYIIAGLGNPGSKYAKTRHNIGWMIAEKLAEKYKVEFKPAKTKAFYAEFKYAGKLNLIVIPTTYMNLSGEAIDYFRKEYNVSPNNILVITDEYNFPVGKLHLRMGGSDGGHNGLTSVIETLGTPNFLRLRCGIDRKFGQGELVEYVLSDFNDDEWDEVNKMVEKGIKSIEKLIQAGYLRAMQEINSGKLFGEEAERKPQKEN